MTFDLDIHKLSDTAYDAILYAFLEQFDQAFQAALELEDMELVGKISIEFKPDVPCSTS